MGRGKALAEKRGEERVCAMSDEPVGGINNQLREPSVAVVVVVVPVRVSEGCRGTIVRRRLGPAEGAFAELASSSQPCPFVRVLSLFRRHHK